MIFEGEQYVHIDLVKEPDSTALPSPQDGSSSSPWWSSPWSESSLVSSVSEFLQLWHPASTTGFTALVTRWCTSAVRDVWHSQICLPLPMDQDAGKPQSHHLIISNPSIATKTLQASFLADVDVKHCIGVEPQVIQSLLFSFGVCPFGEVTHQDEFSVGHFFHPAVYFFYFLLSL